MKFQPWEKVIAVYERDHFYHRYTIVLRGRIGNENKALLFTFYDGEWRMSEDTTKLGNHNGERIKFGELPWQVKSMTSEHLTEKVSTL